MKNQSSLNDIFRFVELKSANLLKANPIKETDNILAVKDDTLLNKKLKAKEVLEKIDSLLETLKFGKTIILTSLRLIYFTETFLIIISILIQIRSIMICKPYLTSYSLRRIVIDLAFLNKIRISILPISHFSKRI